MKDSTFERYCLVVDWWVVNSFNGTKAWQEFYPDTSDEVAAASFVRMLRIDKVAKYKADKMKAASEVLGTSHLEILTELKNWLYSEGKETVKIKLKFVSKEKAMDVVTKHIAFFEDHNKQKSGSTTPEQRAADIAAIEAIMKGK